MAYRDPSHRRPIWPYVVAVAVLGLVAVGWYAVRELGAYSRSAPEFPSLVEEPDPSVRGTVAYYAVVGAEKEQPSGGCVRVVSAAGAPSQDVLCFDAGDFDTGPQLVFLPDGRLEVTMFSWPTDEPLVALWQKIVDVRTGEVEEVASDLLPAGPVAAGPTVAPDGSRIEAVVRNKTAELVMTAPDGSSRTLWSAEVSPEYSMRAVWSPDGQWVLAHDDRLLRVTLGDPADIRILVEDPTGWGGFFSTDPPLAIFAVTDADLLDADG